MIDKKLELIDWAIRWNSLKIRTLACKYKELFFTKFETAVLGFDTVPPDTP